MKIELKIICGRDLQRGTITSSHPYITFEHHEKKYKTAIKICKLNPEWNETFEIDINEGESIQFNCYDKTFIGKELLGNTTWTIPSLPLNQREYFFLPLSSHGHIVISAYCIEGGRIPKQLPYCDVYQQCILKVEILQLQINHNQIQSEREFPKIIIGEIKTSSDTYRRNITKYIQFENEKKERIEKSKIYYIQCQVGEEIQFQFLGKEEKEDTNEIVIGTTQLRIPDYYENERFESQLNCNHSLQCLTRITCLKSVYRNVNKNCLPLSKKGTVDICFPVSFYMQSLSIYESLMIQSNPIDCVVEFETEGIRSRYWIRKRTIQNIQEHKQMKLHYPLPVHVHVNRQCTVKIFVYNNEIDETDENYERTKRCIFEETFLWPSSLTQQSFYQVDCYDEDEDDLTEQRLKGYCIRQRELSKHFCDLYLSEDYSIRKDYIPIDYNSLSEDNTTIPFHTGNTFSQYPSSEYYTVCHSSDLTSSFN